MYNATDLARNQTSGMTLDQYVRHCAGLGLVVRVYRYRCATCGEQAAKAQPLARELADVPGVVEAADSVHAGTFRPKCCGEPMAVRMATRDGSAGLILL